VALIGGAAGVASADRHREPVREHREPVREERREERHEVRHEVVRERERPIIREQVRYRDVHYRPEYRVEQFAPVHGYNWHRGDWIWNGYEWVWQPGWYVRISL
jgi:hypothetical protein